MRSGPGASTGCSARAGRSMTASHGYRSSCRGRASRSRGRAPGGWSHRSSARRGPDPVSVTWSRPCWRCRSARGHTAAAHMQTPCCSCKLLNDVWPIRLSARGISAGLTMRIAWRRYRAWPSQPPCRASRSHTSCPARYQNTAVIHGKNTHTHTHTRDVPFACLFGPNRAKSKRQATPPMFPVSAPGSAG